MRIHATNLTGMGSRRVLESLLPDLLDLVDEGTLIYLADRDPLVEMVRKKGAIVATKRRLLPKMFSRLFEVTLGARQFRGDGPILVLGDVPLNGVPNQTVLVHSPFICSSAKTDRFLQRSRIWLLQLIFSLNAKYVDTFLVQTESMKSGLLLRYNIPSERIIIIAQPPPKPVLRARDEIIATRKHTGNRRLKLFYPSRVYPHKNHNFLDIITLDKLAEFVSEIVLTVEPKSIETSGHSLIRCIGEVNFDRIVAEYTDADALLFLSNAESYGLPLLEAMWMDMPIVCPDLPYARDILQNNPFFYSPTSRDDLVLAVSRLQHMLSSGTSIDWSKRRSGFPETWRSVAKEFLNAVQ